MALTFSNTCHYLKCGLVFESQYDLIYHIEETHIDFNPEVIEEIERSKMNVLVPMSYILKFSDPTDLITTIKEEVIEDVDCGVNNNTDNATLLNPLVEIKKEIITTDLPNEQYNRYGMDFVMPLPDPYKKNRKRFNNNNNMTSSFKKYECPVKGCNKRYKNLNGARYHTKYCHDSLGNIIKPRKDYHCLCGKQYKTSSGLGSHLQSHRDISHGVVVSSSYDTSHVVGAGYRGNNTRSHNNNNDTNTSYRGNNNTTTTRSVSRSDSRSVATVRSDRVVSSVRSTDRGESDRAVRPDRGESDRAVRSDRGESVGYSTSIHGNTTIYHGVHGDSCVAGLKSKLPVSPPVKIKLEPQSPSKLQQVASSSYFHETFSFDYSSQFEPGQFRKL